MNIFLLLRQKAVLPFKDPFFLDTAQVWDPGRELRVEIKAVL